MIQRYAPIWFFRKGFGNSSSVKFCVLFFKKNVTPVILYQLTKFHYLIAFTSWDIGQHVYYNCLFSRLWRHKFWNKPIFLTKSFYTWSKSQVKSSYEFDLLHVKSWCHIFSNMKKEECVDFEHSVIFRVKVVGKNILPGRWGPKAKLSLFEETYKFSKSNGYT